MKTEWTHIADGFPFTDGEKIFVGINSNGYRGCFNNISDYRNTCTYETAEDSIEIMSGLTYWKLLDMPKELTQ